MIEDVKEKELTLKQLLLLRAKCQKPFKLTVEGISMLPILHPGDSITICSKDKYLVGDIVVFFYKNDEPLVHRILEINRGRYFCKGDNSFRIENVDRSALVGAVFLDADPNNTPEFIAASYAVNRIFRRCGYDVDKVKTISEYIEYKEKYLNNW